MIIGFIRSIVSQKRIRFVSAPCLLRIISVSKSTEMIRSRHGVDTEKLQGIYGIKNFKCFLKQSSSGSSL